ncbi:hypothetical protein SPI_00408 [Niveomyces insectorum RCEF 264]|uniref:SnoaL-like domain-containing protein n=1 Tax=Niveomyces insectorum RCEF 264 TaxID=1081102 RepID=A0A168A3Y7_9HYPO|nr:hypothetical protein SPI_00408 [Niveomyces insectorum RCEF 264]
MAFTTHLSTALSPREAVADALHRAILGIDGKDQAVYQSAFVRDDSLTCAIGDTVVNGWANVDGYMQARIFPLVTLHVITNIRVDVKDDQATTASLTAHAVGYHLEPDNAFAVESKPFVSAGIYRMSLVKDSSDGLWKIQSWALDFKWTAGDRRILDGDS